MRLAIFHVLHFLSLLLVGFSAHFRGGTIQWKPSEPFNGSMIISYQFSWRRSVYYCDNSTIASGLYLGEGSLNCYTGCNGYVGTMLYRCTAFSELEDWSYGSNEYQYNATGVSYFQLQFSSCCLLSTLKIGADGSWSLILGGSLRVRNDTGRINSSPSVIMPPIVNVHSGCESLVRLDVHDIDGDFVRCRWASSNLSECGGVCNALPNSTLFQEICVIILQPNNLTGIYPVAIQVEDFARRTDTIPLSSVPLLFLVNVVPTNTTSTNILPCGALPPIFIPPTPPNGSCIPVLKGQSWTGTLLAQRQSYVARMSSISVTGATSRLTWQNDSHISVEVTWTDSGCGQMQNICFSAKDSMGISSGILCFTLLVMKNDGGIEVTAVSESVVLINWTHMKPAQLGFNVSLYRVLNNSNALVSTKVMDGCAQSTQFNGIDGGTPYQVLVSAINELNMVTETIISATFFSSQKAPRVPPYGVEYLVLPSNVTMVKWTQPTLMDARGFVIGYTVFYICNKDGFFESKLFEANTTYLYLPLYNDSEVTCSVQMCSKTVAGCGPLSLPVLVQEKSGPGFQNNADSYGENQIYSSAIYCLSCILLLVIIYSIGITIKLCTMRAVSAKNMPSIKKPEVQLVECDAYETMEETKNHYEAVEM